VRGLAAKYRAAPIRANISIFYSKAEASRVLLLKDRGWKRLARGEFELKTVPGNHFSLLDEPNVEQIAHAIKRSLDGAIERRD
jgi:thioesterase domain-containing protein